VVVGGCNWRRDYSRVGFRIMRGHFYLFAAASVLALLRAGASLTTGGLLVKSAVCIPALNVVQPAIAVATSMISTLETTKPNPTASVVLKARSKMKMMSTSRTGLIRKRHSITSLTSARNGAERVAHAATNKKESPA